MARKIIICMILIVISVSGAFAETTILEMYFPPISRSDATLIRCGNETMLVDCGSANAAPAVIDMLETLNISQIDCIVNSHPHYDHLDGLEQIAQAVHVKELKICFPRYENNTMQNAYKVCSKYGIDIVEYKDNDQWYIGDAAVLAWIKGKSDWKVNNRSSVLRIQFGQCTALLAADAEAALQTRLVEVIPEKELDIDILKYPHHGLDQINASFLETTSPRYVVIPNENEKRTVSSQRQLDRLGIPYSMAKPDGIAIKSNGREWIFLDPSVDVIDW